MVVLFIIGIFVLHKTTYGRQVYAVGGNEEAARLAGISYKKVRYIAFMAAGVCAAIAGIIYSGRVNSGQPTAGNAYEQNIISAVVLGGVRMGGGEGNMEGVLMGVVFMGILANGMSLLNVPEFWQMFVRGSVLLAAVSFDFYTRNRSKKLQSKVALKK
jgi:ribose transport system permease protein/inositol transport system permease protein